MTDSELIILLKNDPERELAETVDKYSGYVYKIAYSKLSGVCRREDIEEAASDIFMKFYEYITTAEKPVAVVAPYLAVIAKRHSINLYKKHISDRHHLQINTSYRSISADRQRCTRSLPEQTGGGLFVTALFSVSVKAVDLPMIGLLPSKKETFVCYIGRSVGHFSPLIDRLI